jgi:hypothetical protein
MLRLQMANSAQAGTNLGKLISRPIPPHPLHISQQLPKKRMPAQRGRIAHQQQLAPCEGHAQVHAADVRQKKGDLALGLLRVKVMAEMPR